MNVPKKFLLRRSTFYHASPDELQVLPKGSWVTADPADAAFIAVGYSPTDLSVPLRPDGGPPSELKFKRGKRPTERPIHLYRLTGYAHVVEEDGTLFHWIHNLPFGHVVEKVATFPSWTKMKRDSKIFTALR